MMDDNPIHTIKLNYKLNGIYFASTRTQFNINISRQEHQATWILIVSFILIYIILVHHSFRSHSIVLANSFIQISFHHPSTFIHLDLAHYPGTFMHSDLTHHPSRFIHLDLAHYPSTFMHKDLIHHPSTFIHLDLIPFS